MKTPIFLLTPGRAVVSQTFKMAAMGYGTDPNIKLYLSNMVGVYSLNVMMLYLIETLD